jgi:hypothetical protein
MQDARKDIGINSCTVLRVLAFISDVKVEVGCSKAIVKAWGQVLFRALSGTDHQPHHPLIKHTLYHEQTFFSRLSHEQESLRSSISADVSLHG